MVTKENILSIVNDFLRQSNTTPKHTITANNCDLFLYNCYSLILSIPNTENGLQQFYKYIIYVCEYYGNDINKAYQYILKNSYTTALFIQYIKDNYRIETNSEIIHRKTNEAFSYVGKLAANAAISFIKPFLPLILIGFAGYFILTRTNKKSE